MFSNSNDFLYFIGIFAEENKNPVLTIDIFIQKVYNLFMQLPYGAAALPEDIMEKERELW